MLDKLKNRMQQVAQTAKQRSQQAMQAVRVTPEIQAQRMSLCESCEHLYAPTTTCKKCGCFMNVKTWIAMSSCPVDKWQAVKINEQQSPPSA